MLGEYGGLGLPISGHLWKEQGNWGYRTFKDRTALTDAYVAVTHNLRPLIGAGLSAAVYTQTTDGEMEVNGLMTYDREIVKMDPARVRAADLALFGPPPTFKTLVETAEKGGFTWHYTTTKPASPI